MPKEPSPEQLRAIWDDGATRLVHAGIADLDKNLAARNLLPLIGEARLLTAMIMHNVIREGMSHTAQVHFEGFDIRSALLRPLPSDQKPPSPI